MKTIYRVLIVAVFGITLFAARVNPQVLIYAVGAGRFDSVEVNLAQGDDLFAGLRWRNIGPFHGGRIAAVTGAIGQPGVFYIGAPAGGIWKTTSAGVTWFPIFDQFTNVDSIGAIQVAPSNPNIVYAGTGDSVQGSLGDGMYKSIDAGKTWTHIGLEDTVKINKIVVDPKDPNLVLASTQGDARHGGQGVYRSTDGGKTWTNVLKPQNVNGTRDLEYAFDMPHVMFATSQGSGGGFGGGGAAALQGPNGTALFKSTDAGKTWKKVDTLPPYTGRISVAIAMHTKGQRVYVVGGPLQGGSGLYRSDDQGATWQHMTGNDTRVANGQGAFSSGVWVDPQDPDILYTVSTTVYRSTDGGKTFSAFKGAPGGHARRRADLERLLPDPDRAGLPHRHRYPVPVLGDGVAAGHGRDHDAQPQRSASDHGRRLVAAAIIRVRHCRARPAQAHDCVRCGLWRRTRQRADQDRSRDGTVGQHCAEFRDGLGPVYRRPRFREAVRHRVRSEGAV